MRCFRMEKLIFRGMREYNISFLIENIRKVEFQSFIVLYYSDFEKISLMIFLKKFSEKRA